MGNSSEYAIDRAIAAVKPTTEKQRKRIKHALSRQARPSHQAQTQGPSKGQSSNALLIRNFRMQKSGDTSTVERALRHVAVEDVGGIGGLHGRLKRFDEQLLTQIPRRQHDVDDQTQHPRCGAPALLAVCMSSARGYDLCEQASELKGLSDSSGSSPPAKRCPKGLSKSKQATFLAKTPVNVAVGTPKRLQQLADEDSLRLSALRVVLLDLRKDVKRETLFTAEPTRGQFWELFSSHIAPILAGETPPRLLIAT